MFEDVHELLAAWRLEIEARRAAGELPEARSYADIIPLTLYCDPDWVSAALAELPQVVRVRVMARPYCYVARASVDEIRETGLLASWELKQFAENGYLIQFQRFLPISDIPRGRRQLDQAEVQLREALALWAWALMPSIGHLASVMPGRSNGEVSAGLALLAETAPSLCALAAEHLAKRPDTTAPEGASDRIAQMHGFLSRLFDEGRRQRVTLRAESGSAQVLFGTKLQDALLNGVKGEFLARRDPSGAAGLAATRVAVLETLAKANLAARSVGAAAPAATAAFEAGLDALEGYGVGPFAALADPDAGKRPRAAAEKVLRSARLPELVRAPSAGATLTFHAGELALIGFFSGVDPYDFCAQHVLFAPEVFAVRDLGDGLLGRSGGTLPRQALMEDLLRWNPVAQPPIDEWETQLLLIRDALDSAVSVVRVE